MNNTTGTSVVNFNDIDLGGYLMPTDTGGTPVVTITGDILYTATTSAWDDGNVNSDFEVHFQGALVDFNSQTSLEFDFDQRSVFFESALVIQDTGAAATYSEPPRYNNATVAAGGSVTHNAGTYGIAVWSSLTFNGAFNIGDNSLEHFGSSWTVNTGGSFVQSATPGTITLYNNVLLDGTFSIAGNLDVQSDSLVALGADVTFNGQVTLNADFGADEDGATTTDMATLRFNGALVSNSGSLLVGEGRHYFGGLVDLDVADNLVVGPSGSNTDPEVHLTGAAQAINFSAGGSYFIVTSVAATTSVTQSGLMILAGDLNLSGSTQATVWTSAAGSDIQVGDGTFGIQGTLTMDNADANFLGITIREVNNGSNFGEHSEYNFTRVTGGTGIINMGWYLTVEGDTTDNSGTGGATIEQESGGAILNVTNCEIVLDKTVIDPGTTAPIAVMILDGESDSVVPAAGSPPAPADWEGNGAELNMEASVLRTPFIKVGVAAMTVGLVAPPITENMGSKFRAENNCTLEFNLSGVGNGLIAGHYAEVMLRDATLGGEGSYQVVTVPETNYTVMWNCAVDRGTAVGGTPSVKLYLGGLNVYLIGNTFNALNSNGVWIRPNAIVRAFNDNLFTNNTGQGGGTPSHITLQGLAAGSAAYWDNNYFDNTVNTGSGGLFVNVMSGSNPVQFRVPAGSPFGFGVVGFSVTAAQAETFDNDAAVVGTDVTWNDAANELTVTDESAGLPAGLVTDSGVSHQTVMLFGLSAAPGNVVVNGVTLEVDAYGASLDEADVASFTLFEDANQNGAYDTGEEFAAATLNAAYAGGGTMTFDLAGAGVPQLIVAGTPQHWGVSVRFAASGNGYAGGLSVNLLPGGITTTDIVAGLPLLTDHIVTGPVSQLAIITQPGGAAATTPLSPQPVIELRDALGNRVLGDSSTTVTASIFTDPVGGSVLGGTTAVAAVDGQVTFTNLSINQAGNGFVLRFTAGAATVDSAAFNITAAPPAGGGGDDDDDGGCSTGGSGTPWLLVAGLLALGLIGLRIARRRTA